MFQISVLTFPRFNVDFDLARMKTFQDKQIQKLPHVLTNLSHLSQIRKQTVYILSQYKRLYHAITANKIMKLRREETNIFCHDEGNYKIIVVGISKKVSSGLRKFKQ